jgi:hypothetical protein
MSPTKRTRRPGELARDATRSGGPRFGGQSWGVADERGDEQRYGKARNEQPPDSFEGASFIEGMMPPPVDEPIADARIESGGEHEGFGRGEKPRKPKSRTKPNPRAAKKTSRKATSKRRR